MKFAIIGLSITSSWGNGHATTYRALLKALSQLEHEVLFFEKDVPYYAANRDLPAPEFCTVKLYRDNTELFSYENEIADADVVIVGSYVQQGIEVGNWVLDTAECIRAFYDIDTPVTLAKLERGDCEYLTPELISGYDMYLSFTGGPTLAHLESHYGSPAARALYCSVDPEHYYPEHQQPKWALGYLGTFSTDRQPTVDELLNKTAVSCPNRQFIVAGPQYPQEIDWPQNVERIEHLPPAEHRRFYNTQQFTLNVTRADMIRAGYSPSVRLFEAAACGVPIISDYWDGLNALFEEGEEILIARTSQDVLGFLTEISEQERIGIGESARQKVLQSHTATARAAELVAYVNQAKSRSEKKLRQPTDYSNYGNLG